VNPKKTDRDDTDLSNAVFCENLARRSNSLDGIAKAMDNTGHRAAKTRHKRGNAYYEQLSNSVQYLCPLQ
jgi:hypothetical protein